MRKRPLLLFISALLFLYFPFELGAQWLRGDAVTVIDLVLSGLLPIVLLVGLIRVTRVGWYTLVATISLWGVRDLYQYYGPHASPLSFLVHLAIYAFSLSYFINPRVRHLYFDPNLRWWRTKPRYETHLPFLMRFQEEWHYPILRNVSEGGCFIETPHLLSVADDVQIAIPLPVPLGVSVIKLNGSVRWISQNADRSGMGVAFTNPEPAYTEALKEFVREQL